MYAEETSMIRNHKLVLTNMSVKALSTTIQASSTQLYKSHSSSDLNANMLILVYLSSVRFFCVVMVKCECNCLAERKITRVSLGHLSTTGITSCLIH